METDYFALQDEWAKKIIIPNQNSGFFAQQDSKILTLDIQYSGDIAFVAGDVQTLSSKHLGTFALKTMCNFGYQAGLFCFREGAPLWTLVKEMLENPNLPTPDLLIVDGHGIAHPRKFGVACWLGLASNMPVLGCAKDTLVKYDSVLADEKNSIAPILLENQILGYALRTQKSIKPVFVSAGHLISQTESLRIIQQITGEYRIPEPLRRADMIARKVQKAEFTKDYQYLGEFNLAKGL